MPTDPFVDDILNPDKEQQELREAYNQAVTKFNAGPAVPNGGAESYILTAMMTHFQGQINPGVVKAYIKETLVMATESRPTRIMHRSSRIFELSLVAREAIQGSEHYPYGLDIAILLKLASEAVTEGKTGEAVDLLSQAVTDLISAYRNKRNRI